MTDRSRRLGGSFRDPSGFVFRRDGVVYRQINRSYEKHYRAFVASGLYDRLVADLLLVAHDEVDLSLAESGDAALVIQPRAVPFISYPYEWCFSQLKDAALATLEIQRIAVEHGQSLKDCSAYNIQFIDARPVFIDTLSFEPYPEGEPWVAYRQFCQHFLAPLALMCSRDVRMSRLLTSFIDGVPLDMASALLPARSRLSFSLLTHIHLHAGTQRRYSGRTAAVRKRKISRTAFLGLIDNLTGAVRRLQWKPAGTEWGDYYDATNYSDAGMRHKAETLATYVQSLSPRTVWDLGANTGVFSRIAAETGASTVAFDIDPAAVEKNYLEIRRRDETNLLPLVMDLTNPSPAIGWAHGERSGLAERGPADMALALALIHHLAISNNLPFDHIASFFARIARALVIEFVPKSDSQVQRLLATREDIFVDYNIDAFRGAFSRYFDIERTDAVTESHRTLFLMRKRNR